MRMSLSLTKNYKSINTVNMVRSSEEKGMWRANTIIIHSILKLQL